mmetsp:Transcript_3259/g.4487  ORF Transcript_3259/g.4487 Transcript_3259/m.4487 type:complete len:530 (-) Transcript_3259:1604-3193(-)
MKIVIPFLAFLGSITASIRIDSTSKLFLDEFNRTRIFHGVNAVFKIAPWYPSTTGFDSENSLSAVDSANLKRWGFNIVRLGVMWPGVEPNERGVYDQSYLSSIETIVKNLAAQNIYVILDMHQDLWHRKFCGEGVPDYVNNLCMSSEPENTQPFPLPAVNATYPIDSDGNPTLESCLSVMFATYYLSSEVGAGFQCLYDNKHNLWDAMAGFWVTVASKFASYDNVIGYELINEPWAGDIYEDNKRLLPQITEKKYLQPLYTHLHEAIRKVDNQKIIFFEGLTIDYWPNGFTEGPGGVEYNDRQALAYHVYCPLSQPTALKEKGCKSLNEKFLSLREEDAQRIGTAMIMTEFGAAKDTRGDLIAVSETVEMADEHHQSWMYWQFKYFQDITTCTPQGESLYNEDGSVCTDKLMVLSRTYPHSIAGTLLKYSFNSHTGRFTMSYSLLTSLSTTNKIINTSEVFVNRELFYKQGLLVTIKGDLASLVTISCPTALHDYTIKLTQITEATSNDAVEVIITKCLGALGESCTCK